MLLKRITRRRVLPYKLHIMGAAQWIFWYGQRLYKIRVWRGSRKGQIARKDWHISKKEFREVAGSDELGEEYSYYGKGS